MQKEVTKINYKGYVIKHANYRTGQSDIQIHKDNQRATFMACYSIQAAKNVIDTFVKVDESEIIIDN